MDFHEELNRRFLIQEEYLGTEKTVNKETPLVSVIVATYQHERFIKQCLDGILMQITNFPIEVIVGEDESKDATRSICIEYANSHQDKIRLFLRDRKLSQYYDSHGKFIGRFNGIWNRMSARGKYIAMCEGDDYWIDPLKLQKQVDFLETNQSFSLVYHNMYFKNELDNTLKISDWPQKPYLTINDLALNNYIYTASVVFRRESLKVNKILENLPFGDYFMWLIIAKQGRIKYFDEPMGVYRIHEGGIWSTMNYHTRQAKTLRGKKMLISYFKNDEIEELLIQSYIDLAFATFLKFIKERNFFSSFYFLLCILRMKKGWIFLMKKILSKLG